VCVRMVLFIVAREVVTFLLERVKCKLSISVLLFLYSLVGGLVLLVVLHLF
jgi:hypothetical protein